jgi:hypothetical protein
MNITFSVKHTKNYNFNEFDDIVTLDVKDKKHLAQLFSEYVHSPAVFKDMKKYNKTHIYSSALPIDIDNGVTWDEAKKILDDINVNYIMYPSKNHKKDKQGVMCDRFHIFIIPPNDISEIDKWSSYVFYFVNLLKGDKAGNHLCRVFGTTPNIKEKDILTKTDGDFDFNKIPIIEKERKTVMVEKDIKPEGSTVTAPKLFNFFVSLSKHKYFGLHPSHFNNSNGSINYYRNSSDKTPALFQGYDSQWVIDKKYDNKHHMVYSPEQIFDVKKPDHESVRKKLKEDVFGTLKILRKTKGEGSLTFIVTNEGVGKSTTFLDLVRHGEMIVTKDKKRLEELKAQYKSEVGMGEELHQIYANTDIIYTNVFKQRENLVGEEEAKRQAEIVVDNYAKMMEDLSFKKMKKELVTLKEKSKKDDNEDDKDFISIKYFCYKNKDLKEEETEMILSFYRQQMAHIIKNHYTTIFITTIHKLKTLLNVIEGFRNKVIHVDEYCPEMFIPGKVYDKSFKMYKDFEMYADNEASNPKTGEKYFKANVYKNFQAPMIIKHNPQEVIKWKERFLKLIIYTTEELPVMIHQQIDENVNVRDHRHHIYEKNFHIINIQSLNGRQETYQKVPYYLQGKARTKYVMDKMMDVFDLTEDMVIVDGLGHTQNTFNIQGSNYHLEKIKSGKSHSLGIVLKHLHPSQIAKYLPLFIDEYLKSKKKYDLANFDDFSERINLMNFLQERIQSDTVNQAIGRVGGYRRQENLKNIYLVVNSKVLPKLNMFYVTDKIFTYSTIKKNTHLKERYPKIYNFLDDVTYNLHLENNEYGALKYLKRRVVPKLLKLNAKKKLTENEKIKKSRYLEKIKALFGDRKWWSDLKYLGKMLKMLKDAVESIENMKEKVNDVKIYVVSILKEFYDKVIPLINSNIRNSHPLYDSLYAGEYRGFKFGRFIDLYKEKYAEA